jgi:hypothetical protein
MVRIAAKYFANKKNMETSRAAQNGDGGDQRKQSPKACRMSTKSTLRPNGFTDKPDWDEQHLGVLWHRAKNITDGRR